MVWRGHTVSASSGQGAHVEQSKNTGGATRRRRDWLKAGLYGAACGAAPGPWQWAQAQSAGLQRLPKLALVIGNSAYLSASPLRNPRNDARALASALQGLGFETTVLLDAPRAAVHAAVGSYTAALQRRKCVGLFFFAGHGVQLAWKNYLLPVDARVATARDVQEQGVELNTLMEGLSRAANPMNIVLLDACRDNPFGDFKPEARGLSQMDAPLNSILGYATSPGNTASDGEGENGLYTGELLREMKVQYTRIEDVFKRVRLAVRRQSHGAQIPWESTSLEDDYYFIPPPGLAGPSEAEQARQYEAELKLWESIENAGNSAPYESYLRNYPSGRFSELAQLGLDQALAREGEKPVQPAPVAGNPYSAGTVRTNTAYKVGDFYSYAQYDLTTGAFKRRFTNTVTEITEREVIYNNGRSATDLLGNVTRFVDGRRATRNQNQPVEYAVGRQWVSRYSITSASGQEFQTELRFRITGKEKVTVPAGTFDCFRLEGRGKSFATFGSVNVSFSNIAWMAPDLCRASIKREVSRTIYRPRGQELLENERFELERFRQQA
jgi:uncharacterized caspase-like protein